MSDLGVLENECGKRVHEVPLVNEQSTHSREIPGKKNLKPSKKGGPAVQEDRNSLKEIPGGSPYDRSSSSESVRKNVLKELSDGKRVPHAVKTVYIGKRLKAIKFMMCHFPIGTVVRLDNDVGKFSGFSGVVAGYFREDKMVMLRLKGAEGVVGCSPHHFAEVKTAMGIFSYRSLFEKSIIFDDVARFRREWASSIPKPVRRMLFRVFEHEAEVRLLKIGSQFIAERGTKLQEKKLAEDAKIVEETVQRDAEDREIDEMLERAEEREREFLREEALALEEEKEAQKLEALKEEERREAVRIAEKRRMIEANIAEANERTQKEMAKMIEVRNGLVRLENVARKKKIFFATRREVDLALRVNTHGTKTLITRGESYLKKIGEAFQIIKGCPYGEGSYDVPKIEILRNLGATVDQMKAIEGTAPCQREEGPLEMCYPRTEAHSEERPQLLVEGEEFGEAVMSERRARDLVRAMTCFSKDMPYSMVSERETGSDDVEAQDIIGIRELEKDWRCKTCTYEGNPPGFLCCNVCGAERKLREEEIVRPAKKHRLGSCYGMHYGKGPDLTWCELNGCNEDREGRLVCHCEDSFGSCHDPSIPRHRGCSADEVNAALLQGFVIYEVEPRKDFVGLPDSPYWERSTVKCMPRPRTTVVHLKKVMFDVYIGRRCKGRPEETGWGNPFIVGKHGDRDEVVRLYREWLYEPRQYSLRERARKELKGKVLACWCSPLACHGDVLAEVAESVREEKKGHAQNTHVSSTRLQKAGRLPRSFRPPERGYATEVAMEDHG